jgi:hypothetical protein
MKILILCLQSHREEDEIYHLTTTEIAEVQQIDQEFKVVFKQNTKTPKEDLSFQVIEDTKVLCKNYKLIIPASPWHLGWEF